MKKLISLLAVLFMGIACFALDYVVDYEKNIADDTTTRFQVGFDAVDYSTRLAEKFIDYDFGRLDGNNVGVYMMANDCQETIVDQYKVNDGDLFRCTLQIDDVGYILMYIYKQHGTDIAWEYYAYYIAKKGDR